MQAAIMRVKIDGEWVDIPAIVGKSAYEQAVEAGYKGTESEFSAGLALAGAIKKETWTFTLEDGTTVTKEVPLV